MLGLFVMAAWLIGLQGSSIQTVSFQKGLWNPVRSRCAQGRAASPTRGGSWNPGAPPFPTGTELPSARGTPPLHTGDRTSIKSSVVSLLFLDKHLTTDDKPGGKRDKRMDAVLAGWWHYAKTSL